MPDDYGSGPRHAASDNSASEGQEPERQRPPEELRVARVDARSHRGALQAVDLLGDALERLGVASPEVATAGALGDLGEERVVDLHRTVLVPQAEDPAPDRHRRHALGADANRVDLHAEGGSRLRGGPRVDRPPVIHAVRQQHDYSRAARGITQAIRGRRDGGADGGAVLELPRLQVVHRGEHDRVVGGERHLRKRLARERHDADPVRVPHRDELLDLLARNLEAVLGLEVLGQHRTRDVERDHDVDTLAVRLLDAPGGPGPGKREHEPRDHEAPQEDQQSRQAAPRLRQAGQQRHPREDDGIGLTPATPPPPERQRKESQQGPRRMKLEPFETHKTQRMDLRWCPRDVSGGRLWCCSYRKKLHGALPRSHFRVAEHEAGLRDSQPGASCGRSPRFPAGHASLQPTGFWRV